VITWLHRLLPRRIGVMGQKILINVAILAAIWIVLAVLTPRFLTLDNLSNVARQVSIVVTIGAVATLLVVSRNFDLSVGGTVALSAALSATLAFSGGPVLVAFAAGIAAGIVVGAVNGFLVLVLKINSVISTLGTLFLAGGVALVLTNGLPVYSMPDGYEFVGRGYLAGVPMPVIIMLVTVLVMIFVERRTLLGLYARATGSDPDAAKLAGLPTGLIQFVLFVAAGAASGWGGIMISSRVGGYSFTVGQGLEFQVIVAIVLGGTSLAGGQGSVLGTLLGAFIIGSINNGLNLLAVPTFWQLVALGGTLVVAVLIDPLLRRRMSRLRATIGRTGSALSESKLSGWPGAR
jgi:ribose/xylose/arabinose/galactoside ABC-type transport system permease subunit